MRDYLAHLEMPGILAVAAGCVWFLASGDIWSSLAVAMVIIAAGYVLFWYGGK